MAIAKLKTDYKDDILASGKREYEMTNNANGTVSLEDVSIYTQTGDDFGGADINATNTAVNELIDKTSNINNTADEVKRVLYAESAGTTNSAQTAQRAVAADTATVANTVNNDFILLNKGTLTFNSNRVCTISDIKITEDSLADVYFTSETESAAERAVIKVDTYNGKVELTAGRTPEIELKATIRIRVV